MSGAKLGLANIDLPNKWPPLSVIEKKINAIFGFEPVEGYQRFAHFREKKTFQRLQTATQYLSTETVFKQRLDN
jgi:hypothetical protein